MSHGGIIEEESWSGVMEKQSRRMNNGGGVIAAESCREHNGEVTKTYKVDIHDIKYIVYRYHY